MRERLDPQLDDSPPVPDLSDAAADVGASPSARGERVGTVEDDPLAQALAWITRHHGRERSVHSLIAGLPAHERLGPDLAVRALLEAGFNAGLLQRDFADISPLLLPAVLLLKNGDACVLLARHADGKTFDVVMPGLQPHKVSASAAELAAAYTGIALVATPIVQAKVDPRDAAIVADPARHWFWGTVRRFLPYYRSALIAALLSNVLMLATGLSMSIVYDKVLPNQAYTTLTWVAIGAAMALLFDLMAKQLRTYLIDTAGRKIDVLIGARIFNQSLAIRMENRPASAGAFAHQVGQIETVREFFASASLSAISDLPFIVIFVGMCFIIGGPLGWVPALAVPVILGISLLIQGALRRAMSKQMSQMADLHGVLVEAVDGIEDLKSSGARARFLRMYEESSVAASESMLRSRRITAFTTNLSMVSQQAITLILLVWGVYLIDAKVVTAGALIGSVMFATRAIAPLSSVVMLATRFQGAMAAMRNLERVMAQPVDRDVERRYVARDDISGRLALREIGFAYPAQGEDAAPAVLKTVNLTLEPGERVAILGRIGSGKSTVLRLLAGLYQPTEGMVEVDGMDLRQIDPDDYRARVGFLSQDPKLFKGTLRDNVLLERATADPSRLGEVARMTGLDRVVAAHPKGWEMEVGESGCLLSGGQRQLVALTRCLLTRPRVLLMDEPTSSMDAQSEILFLRQLKEAVGDCTLVVVTHRPAALELVDRVVVLDSGRIVMDGPKPQVLAALQGAKPATQALPGQAPNVQTMGNVHRHPSTQPVQREAAV